VDDRGYRDNLRPGASHPIDDRPALDRQQPD